LDGSVAKLVTWSRYRESIGDRSGLFAHVAESWPIERVLYPGSYVDLSPSTAFGSVVYVDSDSRAQRFFADSELVTRELAGRTRPGAGTQVRFLGADYTEPLDLPDADVDLIISLYAGPVWEHCRRYLRPGGWLLANTSHGDASLAALDPRLHLIAAVHHRHGQYRLVTHGLDHYLIPKSPHGVDADQIRATARGIAYTQPAFAYLFEQR
jgi:SAM-dependent methyltransferase